MKMLYNGAVVMGNLNTFNLNPLTEIYINPWILLKISGFSGFSPVVIE